MFFKKQPSIFFQKRGRRLTRTEASEKRQLKDLLINKPDNYSLFMKRKKQPTNPKPRASKQHRDSNNDNSGIQLETIKVNRKI